MKKCILIMAAVCGLEFALMVAGSPRAEAQRTVISQYFVSAGYMKTIYPQKSVSVMGGEVYFGQYRNKFYWQGGVQFTPAYEKSDFGCFLLAGGAMYRLAEARSRWFSMYVGGNALFGVDFPRGRNAVGDIMVDPNTGAIRTDTEEAVEGKTAFAAGVEPRVEIEVFPFRKLALVGGFALPVKPMTQQDIVSGRFYVGLRLNL